MQTIEKSRIEEIKEIIGRVSDPEIPVVSVIEMGMVRDVILEGEKVKVIITPTYSGCPAMHQIEHDLIETLNENGYPDVEMITRLSPPWTTDWMSDTTKQKLKDYGIAPPVGSANDIDKMGLFNVIKVPSQIVCPYCDSENTELRSEFGSTACKSMHYCNNCMQPFEHFKCH